MGWSVFLWLQDDGAITETDLVDRLGDDPDPFPLPGRVRRQDAAAVDDGGVVEVAIFVIEVAPVAGHVTCEELTGLLPGVMKCVESTGCGDDPPEAEQRFVSLSMTHGLAPFGTDVC